jgi:sulfatase modifying factor 1
MKIQYILLSSILLITCNSHTKTKIIQEIQPITIEVELNKPVSFTIPQVNVKDLPLECGNGMVRIEGLYCTDLRQKCIKKLDKKRCKEFDKSATICKGKELKLSFCMDKEEYTDSDSDIPVHNITFVQAENLCKAEGKRLCKENEWNLACEGNERSPISYGWERHSELCNIDIVKNLGRVGHLVDHARSINDFPGCISSYGIHNLNGNVDEWILRPGGSGMYKGMLSGGWWAGVRAACRPKTTEHYNLYADIQTGTRCCTD